MIVRLSRWFAPALAAAFALSACAGSSVPAPNAPSFSRSASAAYHGASSPQIANRIVPAVTCPPRFIDCATVSKSKVTKLIWCYGPSSDPCGDSNAGKAKWSGVVCLEKGPTCKGPIKLLTAKWTGPFKCKSSDKCDGTYELDSITPHSGIKESNKYLYKQDIHLCPKGGSCEDAYIGLNVGP